MEALIRKRGIVKSQITRGESYFSRLTPDIADIDEINERTLKLVEQFQQFEALQTQIECHESYVEDDNAERILVEEKYFKAKSIATKFIKDLSRDLNTPTDNNTELATAIHTLMGHQSALAELVRQLPSTSNSEQNTQILTENNDVHSDLRLQRMEIPTFDGDYKNWPEFHDLFKNLIHNNRKISACQKLQIQYLKRSLVGNAQGILKNLTISDANYTEAYNELVSTFNKKEVIVDAYLQAMMEQQKLHTASAESLRLLCSNINESVRALTALDLPTQHWDRWLIYLLASKLDDESLKLWRRECSHKKEDDPTKFADLVKFINNRIYELTAVKQDYKQNTENISH